MACGKPVVLGVDGEARELLEAASAGVFVEPEDPEALAAAVLKLAEEPELRSQFGQNGRRFVVENYDKRTIADHYLAVLSSLVNPNSADGKSA